MDPINNIRNTTVTPFINLLFVCFFVFCDEMILRKDSLGPVVQRPISANPGLNFNPGFHISLFKNCFGIILPIVFSAFNHQIVVKKK